MRSDLKSVEGLADIVTDLDQQTCTFSYPEGTDLDQLMAKLQAKNNKMKDWKRQQ